MLKSNKKGIKIKRIFAVGDLNLDIIAGCTEKGLIGTENHLPWLFFSIGGNAANFAYTCSSLKMPVTLISAIGNDFATNYLLGELKEKKVKLNLMQLKKPNGYSIIFVNKKGERTIYSHKGALESIAAQTIEKKLLPKLREGDFVFFGGYFHLRGLHKGFKRLLQKIKKKKAVIAFDLCFDEFNEWKVKHFLPLIDFLFLNELELKKVSRGHSQEQRLNYLLSKGAANIVLKRGSKGALFKNESFVVKQKAIKTKVIDTLAAGDVFNAGFVYGLLKNKSAADCLRIAAFLSAKKISHHGLVIASEREIKNFL